MGQGWTLCRCLRYLCLEIKKLLLQSTKEMAKESCQMGGGGGGGGGRWGEE